MAETNPYESPKQNVITESMLEYGDVRILSAAGRIGRLRYFAYSIGIVLALYLAMGISMGLATLLPESAGTIISAIITIVAAIAMIYISIVLMIQRLHDTDKSGWLSLIMLIPIISIIFTFYLWFMPGSAEQNRFGNPPPPNKSAVIVVALLGIVIFIGIIAAIAIPSYNEYVQRAQEAATQMP